jgi:PAS domain S-box-containing protein
VPAGLRAQGLRRPGLEKPLRILIVEDVPEDAELIQRELRAAGFVFEAARVEEEAQLLAALDTFRPDIVLSDYRLPRFDGMAATRLVRAGFPEIPVIIVTGSSNEEIAADCIEAGAADYVIKEHLARLAPAVRAVLERAELRAERENVDARQHRVEQDLAQQFALLRVVLDSSDAAIFALDRDLRVTAFNRAHARMVKDLYGADTFVGVSLLEQIRGSAKDAAWMRVNLERVLEGEPVLEEALCGADGRLRRWLAASFNPLRSEDGQVNGAVVVAQDVSERRRREELLQQLHRAVEQSPVSIVITDPSGAIEYVNPRFEQVTGYTASEVLGKNPSIVKSGLTPPEVYRELWRAITLGGSWQGELQNRRKDGSLFWEHVQISAVRGRGSWIRNYVAVNEDITERRRAAEALKHTEQMLMQSQKMEAIGRLAGGVAHDFNNLLSVILGHTERLRNEIDPGHPGRGRVDQIVWAAERAGGLTKQLLAFSRLQVLEPRVIRLDSVMADARQMLERIIGEDVELVVAMPESLGSVRADPGQMVQVLLNLAVNARDAMPRGGRLTLECADTELDERYAVGHPPIVAGRYVMMAVSDTGHGMDAETQRRVFEPFFTTKPEGHGTGLGLSTVYGIVKQSGGFVWVYSEVGIGTTFKVYLPRVDQPPEPIVSAPKVSAPRDTGGASARVLLVEDDDGVRELMTDILETEGYLVVAAGLPAAALDLAPSLGAVDLLVTDVIMPGMSGHELAVKLGERQAGLRTLYVSGYAGEALARSGGIDRSERFLQKPFSERALLDSVAAALTGAERRDEEA